MRILGPMLSVLLLALLLSCPVPTGRPPSVERPAAPGPAPGRAPEPPLSRVSTPSEAPATAPMLRLETGMHTAVIRRIGLDAVQRYLVTGSDDKTVRLWELASGRLLRTLRPPIGAGDEGKIYAVALSPDGSTVAAAGFTDPAGQRQSLYLFDRASGQLRQRLSELPASVHHLAYARDGALLVATLAGTHGMRLYRSCDGTEVGRDPAYGDNSYGADFDPSGRLVTTSWDGLVRLYDRDFRLRPKRQAPGGKRPFGVAFSPDGSRIAVGFADSTRVDVLSGQDLTPLYAPDTAAVDNGDLFTVAWSSDGQWLYAAGRYQERGFQPIRRWAAGGRGAATNLPTTAQDTMRHLLPLAGGGVVFGAGGPAWGVLDAAGQAPRFQGTATADFRDFLEGFQLAPDASTVQFGYEQYGKTPARFTVRDRVLTLGPAADRTLVAPRTTAPGLEIHDWQGTTTPRLNGTPLKLLPYEISRSLAIAPDHQRFLLGTEYRLRLFDRRGAELWQAAIPGVAWSFNLASQAPVAVAAFGDGTIRWYRLRDGQELLAFFPHNDRKRWVLWTPSGYYDASPGAEDLIGWHVNRGRDQEADFFPVGQFRNTFYRPDVVARVLESSDEAEAVRLANAEANRRQETVTLQQRLPPVVQILAPQDNATVSTPQLTVRFSVRSPSGEPVTAVKALVDGRPAGQPRRIGLTTPGESEQEIAVPIPPRDVEVSIIAENHYAVSVPSTIRLRWQGAPPAQAEFVAKLKLYVLAVGVSRYQQPSLNLDFAAKDAQDLSAALRRQHGKLYRDVEVRLLTDAQANRDAVLDGFTWLERQTIDKDVAALFVAGHGVKDTNGVYYFLPANVDPERLKSAGVAASDSKNTVATLAGKVLFFLDTCHSGNVMGSGKFRAPLDITGVINELASAESGAVVFAASTGNQLSQESPVWGNRAFTKALVEGLSGQADYGKKGRITVNMLDLYLSERVKELTGGKQTPTTTKPPSTPDFPVALVP